ncbi:MAG: hypothetical protein AAF532_14370 [Planctomycetota bacterium]
MNTNDPWQAAIGMILDELVVGPPEEFSFVLNPGDHGLVPLMRSLDADAATTPPGSDRCSIAQHAAHLAYALNLFERWAGGEENPFATADWDASWRIDVPDEGAWNAFVDRLEISARACAAAVRGPNRWDEISRAGAVGSVAHVSYHVGAIRQILAVTGVGRPGC